MNNILLKHDCNCWVTHNLWYRIILSLIFSIKTYKRSLGSPREWRKGVCLQRKIIPSLTGLRVTKNVHAWTDDPILGLAQWLKNCIQKLCFRNNSRGGNTCEHKKSMYWNNGAAWEDSGWVVVKGCPVLPVMHLCNMWVTFAKRRREIKIWRKKICQQRVWYNRRQYL